MDTNSQHFGNRSLIQPCLMGTGARELTRNPESLSLSLWSYMIFCFALLLEAVLSPFLYPLFLRKLSLLVHAAKCILVL